jgi:hypothetical protein
VFAFSDRASYVVAALVAVLLVVAAVA